MKRWILILAGCLILLGLWVNENYAFKTTPDATYNPIADYKANLVINNLTITNVAPDGFSATFQTDKNRPLVVEWTVYPSDVFMIDYCGDGQFHSFTINTYPEGGTVAYRITDGIDWMPQGGTEWLYQDLPRPTNLDAILPPPYMPLMK